MSFRIGSQQMSKGGTAEMPEHVEESKGGYACMHCGGSVDEDGRTSEEEEEGETEQEKALDDQEHTALFAKSIKGGK